MAYCGPHGIPHSQFLKWDPLDQDKAIGWALADRAKCPNCGTVPGEWLDEDGRDREPPPYVVAKELCVGCAVLEDARRDVPEDKRHQYHVYLVPTGVAHALASRKDRTSS